MSVLVNYAPAGTCCCATTPPAISPPAICSFLPSPFTTWFIGPTNTGFVVIGHLGLIVVHTFKTTGPAPTPTIAGWTSQFNQTYFSTTHRIQMFTRTLDGSEPTNITVGNTTGATNLVAIGRSIAVPAPTWSITQTDSDEYSYTGGAFIFSPTLTPAAGSYLIAMAIWRDLLSPNAQFDSGSNTFPASLAGCGAATNGGNSALAILQSVVPAAEGVAVTSYQVKPTGTVGVPPADVWDGVGISAILGP